MDIEYEIRDILDTCRYTYYWDEDDREAFDDERAVQLLIDLFKRAKC